ncbi:hypothetical protein OAO87_01785 [bacterium]|nr:hypothetical protein [bacterium]
MRGRKGGAARGAVDELDPRALTRPPRDELVSAVAHARGALRQGERGVAARKGADHLPVVASDNVFTLERACRVQPQPAPPDAAQQCALRLEHPRLPSARDAPEDAAHRARALPWRRRPALPVQGGNVPLGVSQRALRRHEFLYPLRVQNRAALTTPIFHARL